MKFHYNKLEIDFNEVRKMDDTDLLRLFSNLVFVAEDEGYTRSQNEMIADTSFDDFDEDDFHSAIAGMSDY